MFVGGVTNDHTCRWFFLRAARNPGGVDDPDIHAPLFEVAEGRGLLRQHDPGNLGFAGFETMHHRFGQTPVKKGFGNREANQLASKEEPLDRLVGKEDLAVGINQQETFGERFEKLDEALQIISPI